MGRRRCKGNDRSNLASLWTWFTLSYYGRVLSFRTSLLLSKRAPGGQYERQEGMRCLERRKACPSMGRLL